MTLEDQAPRRGASLPVDAGRYYPPESEVANDWSGGIVDLTVSEATATSDVNDGLETVSFAGYRGHEPFGYGIDIEPEATRLLAQRLMAAADEAAASRTP